MGEARRPEVESIVRDYLSELAKLGIKARKAILYGSWASGKQGKESDIDLIMVSPDFGTMNLRERLETLGIAAARIRQPVEAFGCTAEELESLDRATFLKEAVDSGIAVS